MSDEPNESAVWNMDDKENSLIFELKFAFISSLKSWDLEKAYWDLDLLLTEVDSLYDDKDSEAVTLKMGELTQFRTANMLNKNVSDETKSKYFISLRDLYKEICRLIVKNQLYFRKKKSYMGL